SNARPASTSVGECAPHCPVLKECWCQNLHAIHHLVTMRRTSYEPCDPKKFPPFLLSGIPVVAVPPNCPFQSCGYGCCFIAKLRLSLSRADVHMMASHPNAFEWDQWRGQAAFPLAKELAAKLVSPAEGKCQPKGNADGRGCATTDMS